MNRLPACLKCKPFGASLLVVLVVAPMYAFQAPQPRRAGDAKTSPGVSRALILVGIPGDQEHDDAFASIAKDWRDWLMKDLGFPETQVHILFGKEGKPGLARGPARRDAVEKEVAALKDSLKPEDRLWVLFLGHGNNDGDHAYFHFAGRDMTAEDLGKLFSDVRCKEQVFWMTTSASGWFMKALSAKGRIVITATVADDEYNETEFPYALATVARRPAKDLDTNKDGKVSILELYDLVVAEVNARFAKDERAPTEHAQLDDNGDGSGTEKPSGEKPKDITKAIDGQLAATTYLPLKR